jgi:GNAT superfamily N-acetyltransferase
MTDTPIVYETLNAEQTMPWLDRIGELYAAEFVPQEVKDKNPHFYSRERFNKRMVDGYMTNPTFRCVIATHEDRLVGFVYGCGLRPTASWWKDLVTPLDEAFTKETGSRTLALFDMLVTGSYRGQGIAVELHRALLDGRPEERVTLLSSDWRKPAYEMWLHWGYKVVGQSQPDPNGPVLDVFVKELT